MAVKRIEPTQTSMVLGRHTRLGITFQWRDAAGELVDLTGYTARVWVSDHEGNVTAGSPHVAVVGATKVTYQMAATDLQAASTATTNPIYFTCVAQSGDVVLPPNKRSVVVGDWTGADSYVPV